METKLKLIGTVNPHGVTPSFGLPLFTDGDSLFVAKINTENNEISRFVRLEDHKYDITILEDSSGLSVKVGDPALFSFILDNANWLVGNKKQIDKYLELNISRLFDSPFVLSEVGSFLGNRRIIDIANQRQKYIFSEATDTIIEYICNGESRSEEFVKSCYPEIVSTPSMPLFWYADDVLSPLPLGGLHNLYTKKHH